MSGQPSSAYPVSLRALRVACCNPQVECGTFHCIALTKLGDVYTWGFNGNGRLGLAPPLATNPEDTEQRLTPTLIKVL